MRLFSLVRKELVILSGIEKMKFFMIWIVALAGLNGHADTFTWRTFTGWDHGYTIEVNDDKAKISLVEHISKDEDKKAVVRDLPSAKAFVEYLHTLIEMIPGDRVGPLADDGRVIFVTAKSGGKTVKKEILMIDLLIPPIYFPVEKQPEKLIEKRTKAAVVEFKKLAEAYMLQQMMFQLKQDYFDRFKLGDDQAKSKE